MYDTHNLYGFLESIATRKALLSYPSKQNQRPFVLTRSNFVGTGKYVAHWTGDNDSSFLSMKYSIGSNLAMNLFGIPMIGSDICGFNGDTTEELCTRWMQLGMFYAFSRNHNGYNNIAQEPYAFGPKLTKLSRELILQRYSLLQYLYTSFVKVNQNGGTVSKPLFFEYPDDANTYGIDTQFLFGPSILVSPVLAEGETTVTAYIPAGRWYELNNGFEISNRTGHYRTLDAPIEYINVHLRGGYTVARQDSDLTLSAMKFNAFTLYIALSEKNESYGELILDDGISENSISDNLYTHIEYYTLYDQMNMKYKIYSQILIDGYTDINRYKNMKTIVVYGLKQKPCSVLHNNKYIEYSFQENVLSLRDVLDISMNDMSWNIEIDMIC
jgi:alpha-glucosidase (family GH31 glycosyl hydrolase)